MEPSDDVLARIGRIEALDRSGASPGEVLAELCELVREAEDCAGSRSGGGATAEGGVEAT